MHVNDVPGACLLTFTYFKAFKDNFIKYKSCSLLSVQSQRFRFHYIKNKAILSLNLTFDCSINCREHRHPVMTCLQRFHIQGDNWGNVFVPTSTTPPQKKPKRTVRKPQVKASFLYHSLLWETGRVIRIEVCVYKSQNLRFYLSLNTSGQSRQEDLKCCFI